MGERNCKKMKILSNETLTPGETDKDKETDPQKMSPVFSHNRIATCFDQVTSPLSPFYPKSQSHFRNPMKCSELAERQANIRSQNQSKLKQQSLTFLQDGKRSKLRNNAKTTRPEKSRCSGSQTQATI